MKKIILMLVAFCCVANFVFADGFYIVANPKGAKVERFNEKTQQWDALGKTPRLLVTQRYDTATLRISADGYAVHEQTYSADAQGATQVSVTLEPESSIQKSIMLFAIGGTVSSRTKKSTGAGSYAVLTRNLTTYKANQKQGQVAEDSNPIADKSGWYTNTLADLTKGRAAAVGDRIICMVFTPDMKRYIGCQYATVSEEDINNAYIVVNVQIP